MKNEERNIEKEEEKIATFKIITFLYPKRIEFVFDFGVFEAVLRTKIQLEGLKLETK